MEDLLAQHVLLDDRPCHNRSVAIWKLYWPSRGRWGPGKQYWPSKRTVSPLAPSYSHHFYFDLSALSSIWVVNWNIAMNYWSGFIMTLDWYIPVFFSRSIGLVFASLLMRRILTLRTPSSHRLASRTCFAHSKRQLPPSRLPVSYPSYHPPAVSFTLDSPALEPYRNLPLPILACWGRWLSDGGCGILMWSKQKPYHRWRKLQEVTPPPSPLRGQYLVSAPPPFSQPRRCHQSVFNDRQSAWGAINRLDIHSSCFGSRLLLWNTSKFSSLSLLIEIYVLQHTGMNTGINLSSWLLLFEQHPAILTSHVISLFPSRSLALATLTRMLPPPTSLPPPPAVEWHQLRSVSSVLFRLSSSDFLSSCHPIHSSFAISFSIAVGHHGLIKVITFLGLFYLFLYFFFLSFHHSVVLH